MRVTRISLPQATILRVEGRLSSVFVDELARECGSLKSPLILDLANLCGVDAAGAALLARLLSEGIQIKGASHYIQLRIRQYESSSNLACVC